jgi:heme exporter protein A
VSTSAVSVEGVGRRYGRRWALADVSFEVPAGTVVMVAGRNGAGKSTLFRVLATAIRPHRGRASVAGFDVMREREDVRRKTAILSHHNYLYESLTARENLAVVCDSLHAAHAQIPGVLDSVGLSDRANDLVSTFSAGMRKRVSLGRVLLQNPTVILLDEPYGALDPAGFELVDSLVASFKRSGATVLMATHQVERVARIADMTLELEAGRVVSR